MNSVVKTLKERGFFKQCTDIDSLERLLDSEKVTCYIGFDPTGISLHVGHLLQLFAMAHFNRAGHRGIALVGGGTAMIGDPSGKTEMRKILTKGDIERNSGLFKKQISRFIDFESGNALLLNNADWLKNLNYIDFLRDIGSQFSVNRMLGFETYKKRLETGLSFIEFNYQLLQSYDFLVLNREYGCRLQMGGDDQWGNIVAGVDLVRRKNGVEVFGLTSPLITRSDGKKMGKTEKGAVFLDPGLVSPYEFFQYWRNTADADVVRFLKLFTFMPLEEIAEYEGLKDREINRGKEKLAFELTAIVHGKEEAEKAMGAARSAFGNGEKDKSGMPSITIPGEELKAGVNIVELFTRTNLCGSRSEARRLVLQNGASVNEKKINDIECTIDASCVKDGEIILKAGKKRYFRVIIS